jgi:hypothetical protein
MSVEKAAQAYLSGTMSQRKASDKYGVPRSTLQDYLIRQARTPNKSIQNESDNACVLIISDMHAPYNHPDMLDFLRAIKKKYKPDRVIGIGDELDYHAMSFHDSDPDLPNAGGELKLGQSVLRKVNELFPVMDLVDSNHGSMAFRRAKAHGIPRHLIVPYRDAIFNREGGEGWNWHMSLTITLSDGQRCVFTHTAGANCLKNAEKLGMSLVQGHHHPTFCIQYSSNPDKLYWAMNVGCLINDDAIAFAYNRIDSRRPIIGCGIILDGQPKLLPLVMERGGRWNGICP